MTPLLINMRLTRFATCLEHLLRNFPFFLKKKEKTRQLIYIPLLSLVFNCRVQIC